jgi:hypothetical protein
MVCREMWRGIINISEKFIGTTQVARSQYSGFRMNPLTTRFEELAA